MAAGCGGRAEAMGLSLAADGGKVGNVACVFPGRLVKVAIVGCGLLPLIRCWRSIDDGRLGRN